MIRHFELVKSKMAWSCCAAAFAIVFAVAALLFTTGDGIARVTGQAQPSVGTLEDIAESTISPRAADGSQPCDLYGRAGTPCVAAHSMTRALYSGYSGPLYQVARRSDGTSRDIGLLAPGGTADAAAQDGFCSGTTCIVTRIYDQSPMHNDLTIEGRGSQGRADTGAQAAALPVTVNGYKVYGLLIDAGMGYRNDSTRGVARAGQPETMYMLASGEHVNHRCCFDYGNAEVNNNDTGNGHMDAVNLSLICGGRRVCRGSGPWVQADLENGLFMSARGGNQSSGYLGSPSPLVTALLKNNGQNFFALAAGNGQEGGLQQIYQGHEPLWKPGYSPMHQEGAIVLGTGGDNSNRAVGSFFEGVMTKGVSSPAVDAAVQANIVAAAYKVKNVP